MISLDLALIALVIAAFSLVAARLERFSIGAALAFVVIGIVMSADVSGLVSLQPDSETVRTLAELTLTLLLFSDASTVRVRALRRDIAAMVRLLGVALMLTIALGTLSAGLLLPGISLGVALLIGAALAPTDAALGQPVVSNPVVPARVRRLLNVESGLNDGIATPIVLLAITLATVESTGGGGVDWLTAAIKATLIGVGVGVAAGFAGGELLALADARRWSSALSRQLFVLVLSIGCYYLAIGLDGNGFVAAFAGGIAFGAGGHQRVERDVRFTELQGSLLAIGVWLAFGLSLGGKLLTAVWDPRAIVFAILSLTVVRMVPVAIALLGTGLRPPTVLFMGWFGPRGLASIVFLVIGFDRLEAAGVDTAPLAAAVTWTMLLSVVLHGLTAGPLARRYGAWAARLPGSAAELDPADVPARRPTMMAAVAPVHADSLAAADALPLGSNRA